MQKTLCVPCTMFPIRPTLAPTPAPHPDEATAGPSQPRTDPRQSAVDYATRCLGIGKDQYIHWSVEQAMQDGPALMPDFPAAPADVAAARADLAAYAAHSWDDLASPYIQEWNAASDALRRQLDAEQAADQGQPSSPPPQPGAASQQARMLDDWAAQQAPLPRASTSPMDEDHVSPGMAALDLSGPTAKGKEPALAPSGEESLPASPRSAASGTSQDSPIPRSRRNSVDELITQTIQAAQRKKIGKTTPRSLDTFRRGAEALNAKAGRSAIPVEAALERYLKRADKPIDAPKDAVDPVTGEPVSAHALAMRKKVWDPETQEFVIRSTLAKRKKIQVPETGEIVSKRALAKRKKVWHPEAREFVSKSAMAHRKEVRAPETNELISKGRLEGGKKKWDPQTEEFVRSNTLAQRKQVWDSDAEEFTTRTALSKRKARRRQQAAAQAGAEAGPSSRPDVDRPTAD
ncbi:hypothetical protein [Pigmentiphaga sp.]|uniref:hypothetical protein n=1 Tax=Pigmentiphaga sp. TaxID=1977564 RepID=UPI0025E2245D|nr:hypothetical protein [Pigmentiphaga sp.]